MQNYDIFTAHISTTPLTFGKLSILHRRSVGSLWKIWNELKSGVGDCVVSITAVIGTHQIHLWDISIYTTLQRTMTVVVSLLCSQALIPEALDHSILGCEQLCQNDATVGASTTLVAAVDLSHTTSGQRDCAPGSEKQRMGAACHCDNWSTSCPYSTVPSVPEVAWSVSMGITRGSKTKWESWGSHSSSQSLEESKKR